MTHPRVRITAFRRCLVAGLMIAGLSCRSGDDGIGVPSAIIVVSGGNQEASVGTGVFNSPVVRVQDVAGTAIPGVTVRFTIATGGGTVIGDSTATNASGEATVGQWILGTSPGLNTLRATVPSTTLTTNISATGVVGGGVSVRSSGPQAYLALVNQVVTPAPVVRVLDSFGNPVPGVAVTFSVALGGGAITGASTITNADGLAAVGSWTVGPAAGLNTLTARISGGPVLTFTAQGLTSAPVLTATTTTSQSGFLSFPVTSIPRVLVTDGGGHPLPGVPVTFTVTSGDASVSAGAAVSDANGIAAPGDWRLGLASTSTLTATTGLGAQAVGFSASGVAANFRIDVRFLTTISPDVRDAFVAAARRWMRIITAHLTGVTVTLPTGICSSLQPAMSEVVTDVVIFAEVTPIDGPGSILGSAGPCAVRSVSELPLVGAMQFDVADMQALAASNQLVPTITHEMAHVLGFGTIWSSRTVTQGIGGNDPIFVGSEALGVWPAFGTSLNYSGTPVPLENLFGVGTRDVHWRESVFHAELMTGFIEAPGVPMPLSRVTIASMKDIGYQVDYGQADLFAGNLVAGGGASRPSVLLNERVTGPRFEITPLGLVQRLP